MGREESNERSDKNIPLSYNWKINLRRILKYNMLVDFVESLRQRKLEYNV